MAKGVIWAGVSAGSNQAGAIVTGKAITTSPVGGDGALRAWGPPPSTAATVSRMMRASRRVMVLSLPRLPWPWGLHTTGSLRPLQGLGYPVWSKNSCGFTLIVFEEAPKPFATLNRAFTRWVVVDRRKEQDIALALMISLVMIMLHVFMQGTIERRFPKQDHPRETLLFD